MNPKLKRVLSIIGLISMIVFVVLLPLWLAKPDILGEYTLALTIFFFAIGLICFLSIYFFKEFPNQQIKAAERKRIEEEYYKKLAEEDAQQQAKQQESKQQENISGSDDSDLKD